MTFSIKCLLYKRVKYSEIIQDTKNYIKFALVMEIDLLCNSLINNYKDTKQYYCYNLFQSFLY